jgi:uncharacterized membrane protein YkvA (DUF1232 family)
MTENSRNLTNPGFLQGLSNQVRLVARLMADRRINPLLKLLPVGSLIYLVVPMDLMPVIPLDDAAILWLGASLFVELCPQDIVQEHRQNITHTTRGADPQDDAEVIDAEFHEMDPH